jgi:UDP-glucose 4-epimerase
MLTEKQRIAITGASGFIGRHLVDLAVRSGFEVVALSRRGTGRTDVVDVRVKDYGDVERLAVQIGPAQAVVHLAARAHQSGDDPSGSADLYDQANVAPAVSVARAARIAGAGRVVFVSSIGVNGETTHGRPFTASDAPAPVEPYAVSKWLAEQAVARELHGGATDFAILRPPLVYGEGCPGNFGRLLKLICKAPVIPLGGVRVPRTFIYVENLTDAIIVACTHPAASRKTFLLADDRNLSVSEIARVLAASLGRSRFAIMNLPTGFLRAVARLARRSRAVDKLTAELEVNGSEFCRSTGWRPPFSPEDGLRKTAEGLRSAWSQRPEGRLK